jgi:Bacterial archaeo-eukaryotic release factor family 2
MQSERFRALAREPGPFVSVYLDDSRDTPEAVERLEAIWRDLREHLEDCDVEEDLIARLERAVLRSRPAVGRRGRGVIATRDRVLINEHLVSPPPATVLRISDYPYFLPLVEHGISRPTYVFAAVDHAGADITLHQGDAVRSETVDGGGYPVHKPVTAGWNGYGDFQHTTEEAIRMNVRAVAERLTKLVDETGAEVVFVCGEVRSRTDVVSALPEHVAARVSQSHAGARGRRIGEDETSDVIDAEFERRRVAGIAKIAERFQSESGRRSGLAAEGIAAVCAALRAGDVDTLIVGELGDATVVTGQERTIVAPDADVLSDFGEAPVRVVRADEALPFAAITIGASVVRVADRITPTDGIAALLRYPPTDVIDPDGASRQSVAH